MEKHEMNVKECELKDPSTPLIVESFWKYLHFKSVNFVLAPPNYLIGWYDKYMVLEKIIILSHGCTIVVSWSFLIFSSTTVKY
jgi:hypothetical protein